MQGKEWAIQFFFNIEFKNKIYCSPFSLCSYLLLIISLKKETKCETDVPLHQHTSHQQYEEATRLLQYTTADHRFTVFKYSLQGFPKPQVNSPS